jgi:hypothetical protein
MARAAPVTCSACASARPPMWVFRKAATAPSLARPNQATKNSARFSIASATTSPRRTAQRVHAACATPLAAAFTSA